MELNFELADELFAKLERQMAERVRQSIDDALRECLTPEGYAIAHGGNGKIIDGTWYERKEAAPQLPARLVMK